MNENTRPRPAPAAASAPPPLPRPALQASDLVVEMVRTALDEQAITPSPDGGRGGDAAAGGGARDPLGPLPEAPPDTRPDMAAPLDFGPLMTRQGADFVRRAYLEILGREPDERASFYTAALMEGRLSKLEILGGIRFSDEGEAVGREVAGLKRRFQVTRAYRLPVVGTLARLGTALARLPATLRHLQRLEQAFAANAARTETLVADAATERRVRAHGDADVEAKLRRLDKTLTAFAAETAARQDERGKLTDDAVLSLADRVEALEAAAAKAAAGVPSGAGGDGPSLDDLYLAFEDKFRGSRDLIKQRQEAHLPVLEECGAGTRERPVLDVGCGRGEWLELLRERGLVARGVDLNASMVQLCRGAGLDAVAGDAVEHLRRLPDGSLGAVTGFHIIEHLPFEAFVRLLDESLRALASGGAIIFETPNPDSVLVGSRTFYYDPTHRNPMPKEMTVMIAEARGFARAHARVLHPLGESFGAQDKALGERLDALFFGPQDYALVAWKP